MFNKMKKENLKSENNIEKTPEEKLKEESIKKRKRYIIMGVMWGIVVILGFVNNRMEARAKVPEIVFTRTDEAPKEVNDKIYIYYPENNSIKDTEILIPKVKSKDELLKATITATVKKLEETGTVPLVELKDVSYYVTDKEIYLDLPEKIFDNVKNAKSELLIIYSFVNTLTNINGIESVRILINNADLEKVKYANLLKDYTYRKDI